MSDLRTIQYILRSQKLSYLAQKERSIPMSQALMTQEITRVEVEDFLYYQARLLDDRHFEEWIECFTEDAEYWMPAWDDNDELTQDPQSEISLIYYPNRAGLEARAVWVVDE